MTPKPQRKISLQLRLILTIVFIAFAYFVGQYRKAVPRARSGDANLDTRHLLTEDSSASGPGRFAWVPSFPGVEIEGITTKFTHGQTAYGFHFRTSQDFKSTLSFYSDKLKEAGFRIEMKDGTERGGELHAESTDGKRTFDAVAAKVYSGEGTEIGVTAVQR